MTFPPSVVTVGLPATRPEPSGTATLGPAAAGAPASGGCVPLKPGGALG